VILLSVGQAWSGPDAPLDLQILRRFQGARPDWARFWRFCGVSLNFLAAGSGQRD